jgi:hypothetical protein
MTETPLSIITKAIKGTELDSCMWNEKVCEELAYEILHALHEAGYYAKQFKVPIRE